MSAATRASTARKRATIALEMLARYRGGFYGLGRGYDDCFEMNDGELVISHGKRSIERSLRYRAAMLGPARHYAPIAWIEHAERITRAFEDSGLPQMRCVEW